MFFRSASLGAIFAFTETRTCLVHFHLAYHNEQPRPGIHLLPCPPSRPRPCPCAPNQPPPRVLFNSPTSRGILTAASFLSEDLNKRKTHLFVACCA
ncbi:uncharacterized protein CLUP02_14904 [Colletotrichum lupini]|uniref:Uncharacterized protein n=1 Tax=Colletotrichum lupini TaxID=145971 RepID=A0A9Q8WNR4_9PEZI|nr:uncharacterized protein CLUP02_14904 [Colletotrichum lupini]UQC89375.1 hypothetical protein CLUP02_14904 [Colletotrichum lupini]